MYTRDTIDLCIKRINEERNIQNTDFAIGAVRIDSFTRDKRVYQAYQVTSGGQRNLSSVLSCREMVMWLDGYLMALEDRNNET